MYDEPGILTGRKPWRPSDYEPPQLPKRDVDQMTPHDVRQRAKERIEYLKRSIESAKKTIAGSQEELKFWESVK